MASAPRVNPLVSVLLPARNESETIEMAIQSLQNQCYANFEVWVGDDQSTDDTAEKVRACIAGDPRFQLISIPPDATGTLMGKTQALQILGSHAQGDYLLMTDADMELPKTWIQAFVDTFQANPFPGVVVGTTLVKDRVWQSMEWLSVLQGLAEASKRNWPTTGMGNNMAVTKKAWEAVNGFQEIGFSLVEDFALYHHLVKKGYGFSHVFSSKMLGWTQPPTDLFSQRNRWIRGAWKTKSRWLILAAAAVLWWPSLVILLFFSPRAAIPLLVLTWLSGVFWGRRGTTILGWNPGMGVLLTAPIILPMRLLVQVLHALQQPDVVWKDRRYPS